MRAAIAYSLASRLYDGDEYSEVFDSVMDYFGRGLIGGMSNG